MEAGLRDMKSSRYSDSLRPWSRVFASVIGNTGVRNYKFVMDVSSLRALAARQQSTIYNMTVYRQLPHHILIFNFPPLPSPVPEQCALKPGTVIVCWSAAYHSRSVFALIRLPRSPICYNDLHASH